MHFASSGLYSAGVPLKSTSAGTAAQSVWEGTHPIAPGTPGQVGCGAAIEPGMDCGAAALYMASTLDHLLYLLAALPLTCRPVGCQIPRHAQESTYAEA